MFAHVTVQTIFPGALSAPRSPMVPPTPFVDGYLSSSVGQAPLTASYPPRTPYTPFSAFAAKQNPFEAGFGAAAGGQQSVHLLDEESDPLAALYNILLRFVDRELVRVMEAAERISTKSSSRRKGEGVTAVKDGHDHGGASERAARREEKQGFDIMSNVVWAEIGRTIMDELGSSIFASGNPAQFRRVSTSISTTNR